MSKRDDRSLTEILYERNWAIAAHISGLFGSFLIPLGIWWLKSDDSELIDKHSKEAINFQLTMLLVMMVAALLTRVTVGYILLPVVVLVELVFVIQASSAANKGRMYVYPISIRLLR